MPNLYCETHGREHEALHREEEHRYRDAGETVLIVSGRLTSGPYHCDRCNALLNRGDAATLLTAFPRWIAESMHDYDFGYERRYFVMRGEERVAAYGAASPLTHDRF